MKDPTDYGMCEKTPETRYSEAGKVWDQRIGSARVAAANWRLATFCSFLLLALSIGGNIYQASQSSILPYIVQVDSRSGAVLSVAPTEKRTEANDREVEYFLWNLTKKARSIPKDLVVFKQNWQEVYSYLDNATTNKMNNMALTEDFQTKLAKGHTALLTLKGFNRYSGADNTYQIRWEEIHYDQTGMVLRVLEMEAFYSIDFIEVTSESIYLNPLGIIVRDFSISQER